MEDCPIGFDEWCLIIEFLSNADLFRWIQCNSICFALAQRELTKRKWRKDGLFLLAEKGDLDGVRFWVEDGADVHANDDEALRLASMNGQLEVVKYIVEECGADMHADDDSALQLASMNGHLKVVRYLVEGGGANVHANCESALGWASREGHIDIVRYLVEKGEADVHARNEQALRWASWYGHLKIVRYLVEECGANVRNWALRQASGRGHLEVVQYLVKCGADVHSRSDAALQWAIRNRHKKVVKFLRMQ